MWHGTNVLFRDLRDPDRLHALIDAIMLIETDVNLTTLLTHIVRTASELVDARYGAIGVVSADGTRLSEFITYGMDDDTRAAIGPLPHGRGLLGAVMHGGHPLRVDSVPDSDLAVGFPANHPPMERFLGAPIATRDGHIWGNLYVTEPQHEGPFTRDDEVLLATFGRAAGLVIDQAVLRQHLLELAQAEERERLARDLHDTVIQRLFAVGLGLQLSLHDDMADSVRQRINQALDGLNDTVHDIRTTIFDIDHERSAEDSLHDRVARMVAEVDSRLGASATLTWRIDDTYGVSAHVAQHTVQAVREMLSNVVRHSEASQISVDVSNNGDEFIVRVHDNGVGVPPTNSHGRGLRNLRSRAEDLGGTCVIESTQGEGTTVTWRVQRDA
jgi:signal transduction histidine kinase